METRQIPVSPDPVKSIADAVLYEGFMLYPYRRSSLKNRQRWNFGVLFPPAYCERQPSGDRSWLQAECLFEGGEDTRVSAQVRFLQLTGEDAAERDAAIAVSVGDVLLAPAEIPLSFSDLRGAMKISCARLEAGNFKLTVRIANTTAFAGESRDEALGAAFLSTHILLGAENGAFHSMIEAPAGLTARAGCESIGLWPVLVGKEGDRSRMLAAPIILYDYPKIAPQSPGDLFDGTEIDEILSLRIRTLSGEEKLELQQSGRTAALLERAEQLQPPQLASLHGTMQVSRPAGFPLKAGDRVVLRPKRRSDILDLALAGKSATVFSVEVDFEDNVHICVTVDEDPGRDLGLEGKPGHRFFFGLDEVERV